MTGQLIDLAERRAALRPCPARAPGPAREVVPLNRCDQPIITAVCAALRGADECGGLLAYQDGWWQHVNACLDCYDGEPGSCRAEHTWCDGPEPAGCDHHGCGEVADIDQRCARGRDRCCGCCWARDDELEGRRLWPTRS